CAYPSQLALRDTREPKGRDIAMNGQADPRPFTRSGAIWRSASRRSQARSKNSAMARRCEPPPNWWTPLISSDGSGKVSNGPGTASFYGSVQAGISSPAGEQRSVIGADRRGAGTLSLDAAQLAQSQRRSGCRDGVASQQVGVDVFPGSDGRNRPASPRERSPAHGARHFKQGCGHLLGTAEMRFRLIEDHRDVWPVRVMCDALSVSPSGFYAWRSQPESLRKIANRELLVDIRRVHAQHRGRYGAPRIHAELRAEG